MTSHGGLQSPKAFYNPTSSGPVAADTSSNSFQKFRSTLEQSLRTATRSKKLPPTPHIVDELAALARTTKGKEKERPKNVEPHKEKMSILRKVAFRRDSPSNSTPANVKGRVTGHTSYMTPSLRQASMSSPALHTSSQPLPSQPGSSSSNTDALISPTRQRTRRGHRQSPETSVSGSPNTPASSLLSRHPSLKLPPSPSTPSLHRERPVTPTRTLRDVVTPHDTPTPKAYLVRNTSKSSSIVSPALRASSPVRSKSPTNRARVGPSSARALSSASTSHLPLTSPRTPTPPSTPRRSIDTSRRASNTRRPSTENPRHATPIDVRGESPSPICTRTRSPVQRSYSQNRHFNISSGSLVQPTSIPEHRELLRTAASLICKEALKPPPRTEAGQRDWGEVEVRTRALARLERVWSKSGSSGDCSSTNVPTAALSRSSSLTASGEERERRLFCEALRDGYVLCQCVFSLY